MYQLADVNKDGTLSIEEFCDLMEKAKREFPQVQLLFSKAEKNVHKWVMKENNRGRQLDFLFDVHFCLCYSYLHSLTWKDGELVCS